MSAVGRLRQLHDDATPGPIYAVVNDLVGGWCLSTVDAPLSAIGPDNRAIVGDFFTEAEARSYAAMRNSFDHLVDIAAHAEIMVRLVALHREDTPVSIRACAVDLYESLDRMARS